MNLNKVLSKINNFIFAKRCYLCTEFADENNLCSECFSQLKFLTIACKKCQQPLNFISNDIDICQRCFDENHDYYDEMLCPFIYNPFLKKYIVMLKNGDAFYLSDILCRYLYQKIKLKLDKNSIIAPIPLHSSRLFKRGYNQSLILAKSLSTLTDIPYIPDLFMRVRNTNSQANKTYAQRLENVKDSFKLNQQYSKSIENKNILIIDDIITTGATIFECAKTLKNTKIKSVKLLAIGRRVKNI